MSNKLNVLFLVTDAKKCVHFSRLGIALAKRGHRVILLSDTEEESEVFSDELRKYNIDHHTIHEVGKKPFRGFSELDRVLSEGEIDLAHTQGVMQSIKVCALNFKDSRRRGIVTTVNSVPGFEGSMNMGARLISFLLNRCSDFVVCPSNYVRNLLLSNGLMVRKGVVVYNSIDVGWFDQAQETSVSKVEEAFYNFADSGVPNVVCVARLEPGKGIEYLLAAAKKVLKKTAVNFLIIGDGSMKAELQEQAHTLGINKNVFFSGWIANNHIPFVLHNIADVCVLPSLKELLPFFVLESMTAAKPVVSTLVGGIPEVIADGWNGYLVPPGDFESLANALIEILGHSERSEQMGINGRRSVENGLNVDSAVSKLETLYEMALRRG
jgi:glycosyltransferase involved in cell wall biosynthesis